MSHFLVFAIGENVDEQMERYSSHLAVDETVEDIDDAYKAEMLKYYRDKENISNDITFDECYEKFGQRWDGGVCRKDEDGVWRKHIMYNKNAKWDWYMEGGRWSGFIQHFKDNITEILDKDDYTIGKDGKLKIRKDINSVPKKYIDFDAIREKARRDAIREYTEVEEGVGKELIQRTIAEGTFKTYDSFVYPKKWEEHDPAFAVYSEQPIVKAWNRYREECGKLILGFVDRYVKTMDEFVEDAVKNSFAPFALLKDGEWYEKGTMWSWGIVLDEKNPSDWRDIASKILDTVGDDELITILDCHI